jgi:hypothetical protein
MKKRFVNSVDCQACALYDVINERMLKALHGLVELDDDEVF